MAQIESTEFGAPVARVRPGVPRPMLRTAVAVVAGSWLGFAIPESSAIAPYVLAMLLGAWLALRGSTPAERGPQPRRIAPSAGTLLALSCLAALRAEARAPPSAVQSESREFEGEWRRRGSSADDMRGVVACAGGAQRAVELPRGVAEDGELVHVVASGTPSRDARGPAGTPADDQRPAASLEVAADELVRIAPSSSWGGPLEMLRSARQVALERCDRAGDPTSRQLARALLCGDAAALDPELGDLFTRTGLRHELAVSGMNVALLAAFCLAPAAALLGARANSRRARFAVVAAETTALAAYIVLSGNGAPVRRSAVAITLALLAPVFLRRNRGGDEARTPCRADPLSLWCFALTLECLSDPLELRSISLQLSYVATLGLILGTGPLLRILRGESRALLGPPVPQLGPASWWRVLSARAHTLSCSALAASCAAVLATLPLCWNTFGEWSPLGVIATPLSVPFIAWLLVYGWAMIALPSVLPAVLFEAPARALVSLLEVVDDLPGTPAPLAQRPFWLLLGASAAVFAVLRGVGATHTRRVWLARLAGCAWCAVLLPWTPSPSELEVVALDVGHGTSIAVRAPGPVFWIYDCGSRDRKRAATEALAPLLASWEARAVNVVLSHTDRDHAGGLDWLVERYEIESWSGALSAPLGERLPHTVPRLDVESGALDLPSARNRELRMTLLRGCNAAGNEGSRSLRVDFGANSVLLSGDAQDDGLRALLELDGVQRPCQLLLAPHHGSESPWLGPLLDVARPESVWISASSPAACERELDRRRISVRLTRRDGPLVWRPPREPPESAAPP